MPVAIRRKSLEDHVTIGAVLKYSYDDLVVDSCNGAIRRIPALARDLGEGRRARCSSLPERCYEVCEDRCWFTREDSRVWVSSQKAQQSKSLTDRVGTSSSLENSNPFHEFPVSSPSNGCVSKEGLPYAQSLSTGWEEDGEGISSQGNEAQSPSPTSVRPEDHTVLYKLGRDEEDENTIEQTAKRGLEGLLNQVHTPPFDSTSTCPLIFERTSFPCGNRDCHPPEPSEQSGHCQAAEVENNVEVQVRVKANGQSVPEDPICFTSARSIDQEGQSISENPGHSISECTVATKSICSHETLNQTMQEAQRDLNSNADLVQMETVPDETNEKVARGHREDVGESVSMIAESENYNILKDGTVPDRYVAAHSQEAPGDCDARTSEEETSGMLFVEVPRCPAVPEQHEVHTGGSVRAVPYNHEGGDKTQSRSFTGHNRHTGLETGPGTEDSCFRPMTKPTEEAQCVDVMDREEPKDRRDKDNTVKLRRKGPKAERGHSRLDSMVLLIMKLDQLDHDIEDALSGASCRPEKGPSEANLGRTDTRGDSTHSLAKNSILSNPHHSTHLLVHSPEAHGMRPKSRASPASGKKDKADDVGTLGVGDLAQVVLRYTVRKSEVR